MYAISHAATALVLRRRYPVVAWWPLLVAVQAVELLWVVFTYAGLEHVAYAPDAIRLDFLPYSHSVLTGLALASAAWLVLGRRHDGANWVAAVALGIMSHIVLDIVHHEPDVALWPSPSSPRIGFGLMTWPLADLFVELAYGVLCWWYFRGGIALLVGIVLFNLLNVPLMFPRPGTGSMLAQHPAILPTLIMLQIVATWLLVRWLGAHANRGAVQ